MATEAQAIIKVVEGRIVPGTEFALALDDIRAQAKALKLVEGMIPPQDRDTCEEAKRVVKRGNDLINAIFAAAEPERLRLQGMLDALRDKRAMLVAQFANITGPLDTEVRAWSIREQEAAKKEQDKINKGKRAEDRIIVKPNVPAVSGTRFVVHYRADVVNVSKVKREWMMPDLVSINAEARKDKDPQKTEAKVGGIKVWKE